MRKLEDILRLVQTIIIELEDGRTGAQLRAAQNPASNADRALRLAYAIEQLAMETPCGN